MYSYITYNERKCVPITSWMYCTDLNSWKYVFQDVSYLATNLNCKNGKRKLEYQVPLKPFINIYSRFVVHIVCSNFNFKSFWWTLILDLVYFDEFKFSSRVVYIYDSLILDDKRPTVHIKVLDEKRKGGFILIEQHSQSDSFLMWNAKYFWLLHKVGSVNTLQADWNEIRISPDIMISLINANLN